MSLRFLRTAIRHLDGLAEMDEYGISQARVKIALDSAQMEALPFVYGSMGVLFVGYALLQAFVLRENGRWLMVGVALASAAFLFMGRQILRRGLVPPHWSEQGTAVVAGLILISILLRLYLTADPNQAANLALFLFGMGVLFISPGWYLGVSLFSLAAFGVFVSVLPPSDDWAYFTVMNLAALATGMVAHVVRVRAFRRTEILRDLSS